MIPSVGGGAPAPYAGGSGLWASNPGFKSRRPHTSLGAQCFSKPFVPCQVMKPKTLLFEMVSRSHYFRIANTKLPAEEVTETAEGSFNGRKFRTLYTVIVNPMDGRFDGRGILYSNGSIPYEITGSARGGKNFTETVRGRMVFGKTKARDLNKLENVTATFEASSSSEGKTKTRVWGTAK